MTAPSKSAVRRHKCTYCPDAFETAEGVIMHERTVHRELLKKLMGQYTPQGFFDPLNFAYAAKQRKG